MSESLISPAVQMLLFRGSFSIGMAAFGALLAVGLRRISHLGLCVLISFAAGALLTVALFDLVPETLEGLGWALGGFSLLSGYALFWLLTRFVFHVCPACAATHTEANFKAVTAAMLTALGVHSFMDGLAIASGSAKTLETGLLVFLGVAYHKFPEGLALALVARGAGASRAKAFGLSVGLEATTTILGLAAGAAFFVVNTPRVVDLVIGHVGGGFLFLVFHALLGEALRHHPRSTVVAVLAGALSIGSVGFFIGAFG